MKIRNLLPDGKPDATQPVASVKNLLQEHLLPEKGTSPGMVTLKTVRERARELAVANGRTWQSKVDSDSAQARRELTGEPEIDPKTAALESAPESERWDPLPGSTGHKVPAAPSEDEDEDGRSANTKFAEEGIAGAEHDQRRQADKEAAKAT